MQTDMGSEAARQAAAELAELGQVSSSVIASRLAQERPHDLPMVETLEERMSQDLGMSQRAIRRSLAELVKAGFLTRESRGGLVFYEPRLPAAGGE